jgi:hypothetical protein
VAYLEASLSDPRGRLIATATANAKVIELRQARAAE